MPTDAEAAEIDRVARGRLPTLSTLPPEAADEAAAETGANDADPAIRSGAVGSGKAPRTKNSPRPRRTTPPSPCRLPTTARTKPISIYQFTGHEAARQPRQVVPPTAPPAASTSRRATKKWYYLLRIADLELDPGGRRRTACTTAATATRAGSRRATSIRPRRTRAIPTAAPRRSKSTPPMDGSRRESSTRATNVRTVVLGELPGNQSRDRQRHRLSRLLCYQNCLKH